MKVKSTHGFNIEISPWTDAIYGLLSVQLYEELGGALPKGRAEFMMSPINDAKKMLTDQLSGTIKIDGTLPNRPNYSIPIFVTGRQWLEEKLIITFNCVPGPFFNKLETRTYSDVNDAVSFLSRDIKANGSILRTDLGNFQLNQCLETDHNALNKFALGVHPKVIYGIGFKGLVLRKVTSTSVKKGKEVVLLGPEGTKQTSVNQLSWNNAQNNNNIIERMTDNEGVNFKVFSNFTSYNIVGVGAESLGENYTKNKIWYDSVKQNAFEVTNIEKLPKWTLGQQVHEVDIDTKENKLPKSEYIVYSNEFFFRMDGADEMSPVGTDFMWRTRLVDPDSGNWSKGL